ncbi:TPA: hypothetical protein ACH3X3_002830 [Trebouxia sp. C0006]
MPRQFPRRGRSAFTSRLVALPIFSLLALVCYTWAARRVITQLTARQTKPQKTVGCVAWRKTHSCSPFGERDWAWDRDCDAWISMDSGYCECSRNLTTKRLSCGRHTPFNCAAECGELRENGEVALALPHNVSCPYSGSVGVRLMQDSLSLPEWRGNTKNMDAQAAVLWGQVMTAVQLSGYNLVPPPGARGASRDWVRDGVRMQREDIMRAQTQWRTFLRESPAYPVEGFSGRGIVILAGGLTYMVPAWVNIHMLRRTGCTLPVEMFFPGKELPTAELEAALSEVGVVCRPLPDLQLQDFPPSNATDTETDLSGFTMKVAALVLSRFQEVIFLDSDNIAIEDPEILFSSAGYKQTGALLWPDYWHSSAAPDLQLILDVPSMADNTFESGQMVFDKKRVWEGLLLAAFFNMQSNLYYELFSNFMGKGDKESFAHALRAARLHYHLLETPVGSLGIIKTSCSRDQRSCWQEFAGNTMTQYDTDGKLMFLHTNLSPKWSLEVPAEFAYYNRRWQVLEPGNTTFLTSLQTLHRDLEAEIYQILVDLRCAEFLDLYVATLESDQRMGAQKQMPLGLKAFRSIGGWTGSFHPLNNGIDFRRAYVWGLTGPYLQFTPTSIGDHLLYIKNTWGKAKLGRLHRFWSWVKFWRRKLH